MKKQIEDAVGIKLESHNGIKGVSSTLISLAEDMNINIQSFVASKKKRLLITLISGPHVHKKSRDQYHIEKNSALIVVGLPASIQTNGKEYAKFLEFKKKLYEFYLDEGLVLTFTCLEHETLKVARAFFSRAEQRKN